jgi:hypothetical protein
MNSKEHAAMVLAAQDHTFTPVSMYGSVSWAAAAMGVSKDTFYRKRKEWADQGFPAPDPINNHYIKADVEAWVANRRIVTDRITHVAGTIKLHNKGKANLDAL